MMLRLQRERMSGAFVPSVREYFRYHGLDEAKLKLAKPNALVMHPGPMNRGVEIASRNRRRTAKRHPGTGRDGRCRANGGHGSAARSAPQQCGDAAMSITLFTNARVVDPSRNIDEIGAVLVAEGRIIASGASAMNQGAPGGATVIDCKPATHSFPAWSTRGSLSASPVPSTSRDDRLCECCCCCWRRHVHCHDAGHRSGH
jgi:hypothetical protein